MVADAIMYIFGKGGNNQMPHNSPAFGLPGRFRPQVAANMDSFVRVQGFEELCLNLDVDNAVTGGRSISTSCSGGSLWTE